MTRRCLPPCLLAIALMLCPAASHAGQDVLDESYWSEPAHGLKLRPPAGATMREHLADGGLAAFVHPAGYRISVYIHDAPQGLDFKLIKEQAALQFGYVVQASGLLDMEVELPPRSRGTSIVAAAEDADGRSTIRWAQVFIAIGETNFAVIQLNATDLSFEEGLEALRQVVQSVDFMDQAALVRARKQQVQAGEAWLAQVEENGVPALPAEQWFRVVHQGQDIGYQRIQVETDAEQRKAQALEPGTMIRVQTRIARDGRIVDTLESVYESQDRELEVWELTATIRKTIDGQERTSTWVVTGFRTGDQIHVTRDEPAAVGDIRDRRASPVKPKTQRWPKPPEGYISQVDLLRLTPVWPTLTQRVSFYAYEPETGVLAERMIAKGTDADGTHILIRPAPHSRIQTWHYDDQGRLKRRVGASGIEFVATTADQIRLLWDAQPPRRRGR